MILQAQGAYRTAFLELERWGLRDAILPFLLYFAILFAVLQQIKLFRDEKGAGDRKINGAIAFVISAMIVLPHILQMYPATKDPVIIMYKILPASTIIIIAVTIAVLLMGLVDFQVPAPLLLFIGLGAVGIIVYIILMNMFPTLGFRPMMDAKLQALLIVILIFGLVVFFIVRAPPTEAERKKYLPHKWLRELFGFEGLRRPPGG